jgi:hypothetical protein
MSAGFPIAALAIAQIYLARICASVPREPQATHTLGMVAWSHIQIQVSVVPFSSISLT